LHFSSVQGHGPAGRLNLVHGSHPPPLDESRRGVDLVDIAVLLVPILLAIAAFALANLL
jgi:hypothetical protein